MTVVPVRIKTLDDSRVADFRAIPDPVMVRQRGLFVAEGRFVVRRVLASADFRMRALLVTPTTLETLRDALASAEGGSELPVYVAERALFRQIGGYDFHQGCLGLAYRPEAQPVEHVITKAGGTRSLIVLERVGNPDNIGGIFRNAAALGAGAVLLSPGCGDPLYRKAIRTSIGASLVVPHAVLTDWPGGLHTLRSRGYDLVALTPAAGAGALQEYEPAVGSAGVALILGNEGDGLTAEVLARADVRVRIPITLAVDSLNVATTAAIALYHLRARQST